MSNLNVPDVATKPAKAYAVGTKCLELAGKHFARALLLRERCLHCCGYNEIDAARVVGHGTLARTEVIVVAAWQPLGVQRPCK